MKSKNYNKVFNILKRKYFKYIELDPVIESKFILQRSGENFKKYLFSFYNSDGQELSLGLTLQFHQLSDMHKVNLTKKKKFFIQVVHLESHITKKMWLLGKSEWKYFHLKMKTLMIKKL